MFDFLFISIPLYWVLVAGLAGPLLSGVVSALWLIATGQVMTFSDRDMP